VPLFDLGLSDTAYPYLLFLSQAETERILTDQLRSAGIAVQRGVELTGLAQAADTVIATLRHADGRIEPVTARYVVGCDGAHSAVRANAGIGFTGSAYPQTFVLADTEADGLEPGAAHAFISDNGLLFFFPLGAPATWRLVAMRPPTERVPPETPVDLDEVQAIADRYAHGAVRLHDPVWMTNFRLHHRAAASYRAGRIFLAGDAAHIHSPAGAQGMNTGIQDAVNLGWKLAGALAGAVNPAVLETYHAERAPIGARVLRFTDRAFTIATSANPLLRFARTRVAPTLISLALGPTRVRAHAFRTVSQLAIRYRTSALSHEEPGSPRRGPRAGDRLPDAPIAHDGLTTSLHAATAGAGWHVLLCGPGWNAVDGAGLARAYPGLVIVHRLGAVARPGVLHDPNGRALSRLGLTAMGTAVYLVRPDGHIGYRSGGTRLGGLTAYLRRWLGPGSGEG
jgi:2-polyprenyl-6-methoxyphenol hydroxylase-like FAD-dependent oxidoreductase